METILGVDLGSNSIGWVLLKAISAQPTDLVSLGIRAFEAGVKLEETDPKKVSRNVDRREARARRRGLERRQRRLDLLRGLLTSAGLLPDAAQETDVYLSLLDKDPYVLRARALDHPLAPHELGRSLYHLGKRRGFKSNRLAPVKEDEDKGKVALATGETELAMLETGSRTYGEYLSCLNPHDQRLRKRYTLRRWFEIEFEAIWAAQQPFHKSILTEEFKRRIQYAIFFQRPLKSQTGLIGRCDLERLNRRAPMGCLAFQRFRILQDVNHLLWIGTDGQEHALTSEQRAKLVLELESIAELKFGAIRKLLKIPTGTQFNLERADRKHLVGNRSAARLRKVFGERWEDFTHETQTTIVDEVLATSSENGLANRGLKAWELNEEAAARFGRLELEPGYAGFSRRALRKLLPLMEQGVSVGEAKRMIYGDPIALSHPENYLPPLNSFSDVRNPIVERALTELRKVVNELIRRFGKPSIIRIELARDLKRNAKQREEIWKQQRDRERQRNHARTALMDFGIAQPRYDDILKYLLAEECNRICPYSGKTISNELLFNTPEFEIEHIIPFRRCLDDSFGNKTLCHIDWNRRKNNRTPYEAFGQLEDYPVMLARILKWKDRSKLSKLRRFEIRDLKSEAEFIEDFSQTQLNDTRYASRLAFDYLKKLYGPQARTCVQVNSGGVTAYVRSALELNGLLNASNLKSRDDHRHHAVDAFAVAVTDSGLIHRLARAAKFGRKAGKFDPIPPPWPGFMDALRSSVESIIVSHRVARGINGPLHNDSHYGMIQPPVRGAQGETKAVIRKPLDRLSDAELKNGCAGIVDKAVREAVQAKLTQLGLPPQKAFQDPLNFPSLRAKDGRLIPIKRVRVFQRFNPTPVGEGPRTRHVTLASNHHLAVYRTLDKKGKPGVRCEVIPRLECMRRLRAGKPIVSPADAMGNPLLMHLINGDSVYIDFQDRRILAVVQSLSERDYRFRPFNDARKVNEAAIIRLRSDQDFLKYRIQKVQVSPTGLVVPCRG